MSIGKNRKVSVHRYAWERAHGPIPEGLSCLHLCDEPACVNIDHLVLGTQRANMADRQLKRRTASGARNGRALLNEEQVLEVRRMRGRVPAPRIAQLYNVSEGAIHAILSGENWKHLPMTPAAAEPRAPEARICRNCERPVRGSMSAHWQKCLKETA